MSEPITNLSDAVRVLGALPMGIDLAPLELTEQQIEALAAAGNRVVNDQMHQHLCMCDAWPERCVSTGNYYMGAWDVDGLADALPAVLALWEQMRGGELLALRARVAELEAERQVTNEALDNAARALRVSKGQPAPMFVPEATPVTCRCDEPGADPYQCEADDCTAEFSELNPFGGGARPVTEASAEVSRACDQCTFRTSVWHVDDGSADEELHRHVTRVHGGTAPEKAGA